MTDSNGCPIPCPTCGSDVVFESLGHRILAHNPGCTRNVEDSVDGD